MAKLMVERLAIMTEKEMLKLRSKVLKLFDEATRLRYARTKAKPHRKAREKPMEEEDRKRLISKLVQLNQAERDGIRRRLLTAFAKADGPRPHRYARNDLTVIPGGRP